MNNLNITTRENFNGAHGKDFIIEGVGSFFLTSSNIRKIGGVKRVKEVAKVVYSDFGAVDSSSVICHSHSM